MRWIWWVLSLLLVFTGCAHSGIPTLPASHGHLTSAMDAFLEKQGPLGHGNWGPFTGDEDELQPPLELEPAQAPLVFEEALGTLRAPPGERAVLDAFRDILAACDAGLAAACQFVPTALTRPEAISPAAFTYPPEMLRRGRFGLMVFRCLLGADGKVHDCKTVEGTDLPGFEQNRAALYAARYRPATIAGHAVSLLYTFNVRFNLTGGPLSAQQELAWARLRVHQYPESRDAWLNLALRLAEHAPEDPLYPQAVARAHALSPRTGWAASEAAWQQVQAGQYAPALVTVRPAVRRERPNPYVLETTAAAHFGLNQCPEALAEQQKAVQQLPPEWPAPERERFQHKLQDYQTACAAPPAVSGASGPH